MADTVRPEREEDVAAALREAAAAGRGVVVRGGGTKIGWGLPLDGDPLTIQTGALADIVALEPGDFVCAVGAGMRLSDLQTALDAHPDYRQRLMLDPPHGADQTIGGIVATNASGPLRHRYGAPRDLVLGARFVTSDGIVAKAGGRVVKNVAGYDVAKLMCGSLGTLAVLTEVVFKLHPVPERSRTIVVDGLDAVSAGNVAALLRTAPLTPSAIEVAWPARTLAVRISSTEEGAAEQVRRLLDLVPGAREAPAEEADALVAAIARTPWDEDDGVVCGFGIAPARLADLLALAERHGATLATRASVGVGEARLDAERSTVAAFRAGIAALDGHCSLRRAPAALRDLALPDRDPVALDLMRAVKQRLDPDGILPSRLWEAA